MRPLSEWQDISAASIEIALQVRGPDSARALNVASTGRFCAGECDEARELAKSAQSLAQQCGDPVAEAMSLANLSLIEKEQGRLLTSSGFCSDAIDILRALDEPRRLAACLANLGGTREGLGQLDKALECYYQAADIARELRDPWTETRALVNVAELKLFNGDVNTARTLFLDYLLASQRSGDIATIAFSAEGLSMSLGVGRAHLAALILGFARSQRDKFDLEPLQNWKAKLEDHRSNLGRVIGAELLIAIEASGAELSVNDIADAVGAEI
jgi:tetratricopeptide (TPR) repeat protein